MTSRLHALHPRRPLHQLHLARYRRPRSLVHHLLRGVARALALGIAAELAILVGTSAHPADGGSGTAAWSHAGQPPAVVARLMERYDCSTTGYGDGIRPRSSIVETVGGRYRLVSFDHGWAVHTGDAPGTLVAVCLRSRA